jgi:hypothetical protein
VARGEGEVGQDLLLGDLDLDPGEQRGNRVVCELGFHRFLLCLDRWKQAT